MNLSFIVWVRDLKQDFFLYANENKGEKRYLFFVDQKYDSSLSRL